MSEVVRTISPVLRTMSEVLRTIPPVIGTMSEVLRTISPVLGTMSEVLQTISPVVRSMSEVLRTISPVVRSMSEVLRTISPVLGTMSEVLLVTLDADQIRSLRKVSNGFRPFLDKAHAVATTNREILPQVFPYDEFIRDYELGNALGPVLDEIEKLASAVRDTVLAANSDALVEAMEVYSAVKVHRNKVPGLDVAHDNLAVFFQKTRRKPDTTTAA
jgi:hypothetical protein